MPGDRVHQMGLAEADAAIEEKRVERHRLFRADAGFGDPPGGGMGQFVGLADDEILEGEARVERRGQTDPFINSLRRDFGVALGIADEAGWAVVAEGLYPLGLRELGPEFCAETTNEMRRIRSFSDCQRASKRSE